MKITPEFMNAMGSGANPKDVLCMEGFALYMRYFDQYPSNDYADVYAFLKARIEAGEVEREKGLHFLTFARGLRTKAQALRLGGDAVETEQFRFDGVFYGSLSSAQSARTTRLEEIRSRPLEHVNVLRHVETAAGMVTAPVKAWGQIISSQHVTVFDPETGRHNTPQDVHSEVLRVLEHTLVRVPVVEQKIRDTQEGFEAWEPINET
jgi:hypothetical protein